MIRDIFYIILIIILIVILVVQKQRKTMKKFKGAYLNYNSTNSKVNGEFNASDLAYPQVLQSRYDMNELFIKIKKIVNAPPSAKVVINSGATESIAQCIFWAKNVNQFGKIQGTDYDHSAVKDNCEVFGMPYDNETLQTKRKILDTTAGIFLTQVNGKTGEIMNIDTFTKSVLNKYVYINSYPSQEATKHVRQNKPLIFIDASQSIMKVPIDMEKWEANAVFFSLHKLGGPIGTGILIINDPENTFKPLISGKQQNGLRGGTYSLDYVLNYERVFDDFDDFNTRIETWTKAVEKLKGAGLNVYTPKGKHLYNTILIETKKCPLSIINDLAQKEIYVGNVSACANETEFKEEEEKEEENHEKSIFGGEKSKAIRISFKYPNEITEDILDEIIANLKS